MYFLSCEEIKTFIILLLLLLLLLLLYKHINQIQVMILFRFAHWTCYMAKL